MRNIGNIKNPMRKEKVNALLGGKVVSSFLKRYSEIVSVLENFICVQFPCQLKLKNRTQINY